MIKPEAKMLLDTYKSLAERIFHQIANRVIWFGCEHSDGFDSVPSIIGSKKLALQAVGIKIV